MGIEDSFGDALRRELEHVDNLEREDLEARENLLSPPGQIRIAWDATDLPPIVFHEFAYLGAGWVAGSWFSVAAEEEEARILEEERQRLERANLEASLGEMARAFSEIGRMIGVGVEQAMAAIVSWGHALEEIDGSILWEGELEPQPAYTRIDPIRRPPRVLGSPSAPLQNRAYRYHRKGSRRR